MIRPTPKDVEVKLDPDKYIYSKTDEKGVIIEGNDYFMEVTGYNKDELIGSQHNIIRHPDMPKIIFKVMWKRIKEGKNVKAIVKNMTKDGKYYWAVTDFEPKYDHNAKAYVAHAAFRRAVGEDSIRAVVPLYEKLLELEKEGGIKASEKFLNDFLAKKDIGYDEFIADMVKNKSVLGSFMGAIGKFFGFGK